MGWPFRREGLMSRRAIFKPRINNPAKQLGSGNPTAWTDKAGPGQSIINGSAVRTSGNPWGDSDGGTSQVANMVSNAWKGPSKN